MDTSESMKELILVMTYDSTRGERDYYLKFLIFLYDTNDL